MRIKTLLLVLVAFGWALPLPSARSQGIGETLVSWFTGDVNVGHSDQGSRQSRFDGERRIADGGTMAREDVSPSHRVAADRLVDVRV